MRVQSIVSGPQGGGLVMFWALGMTLTTLSKASRLALPYLQGPGGPLRLRAANFWVLFDDPTGAGRYIAFLTRPKFGTAGGVKASKVSSLRRSCETQR